MANAVLVVSNTTPLINLAGVGLLELLPDLYGAVTVAKLVIDEYRAKASHTDPDLRSLTWLTVVAVSIPDGQVVLPDAGEAATITLAQQLRPCLVLLDERRGGRIARERGRPIIGTGALLVETKRQGLLPAVAPGRYISERLRLTLLEAAGEHE